MFIVLDGYNVLRQYEADANEAKRAAFIKLCIAYAKRTGNSMLIVFDSGPFIWPYKEKASKLVTIAWPGTQQSADNYIKEMLEGGQKCNLLVSSDNELRSAARHAHIESMKAQEFLGFLFERKVQDSSSYAPLEKLTNNESPELDALMEEAAQDINKAKTEDFSEIKKSVKSDKSSKQERVQERIRKKL